MNQKLTYITELESAVAECSNFGQLTKSVASARFGYVKALCNCADDNFANVAAANVAAQESAVDQYYCEQLNLGQSKFSFIGDSMVGKYSAAELQIFCRPEPYSTPRLH